MFPFLLFANEKFSFAPASSIITSSSTVTTTSTAHLESGSPPSHPRSRSGGVVFDHEFITQSEARNRSTRDMLAGRLNTAQAHLNKDAIRAAYLALAQAEVLCGDLTAGFHAALRAKDYCTNRAQTSQVSFLVLELAIHLQNYAQVKDFSFKVQHTLLPVSGAGASSAAVTAQPRDQHSHGQPSNTHQQQHIIADKLLVASALERLAYGDYREAASKFRLVCSNRNSWEWGTLIAPEDIATYAAVTSMATASRQVLIDWMEQPEALEFLAPALKDAMFQLATRANYAAAWKRLRQWKFQLEMDVFLSPHVHNLFIEIRESCILDYWVPYDKVHISQMALDLDIPEGELVPLVEHLLCRGVIKNCRVDCRSMCLLRDKYNTNEKTSARETRRKLIRLGQQVMDDAKAMIIRLACVEQDLAVVDPQQKCPDRGGRRNRCGGGEAGTGPDTYDVEYDSADSDIPMVDVSQPVIVRGEEDNEQNPEDLY